MFPIRDHNPSGRRAYVTLSLILVNIAVFLAYWTTLTSDTQLNSFFFTWGLVPENLMRGQGWITVVTSMFLHGGWMHLIGNLWFLWIFGDNLEDEMGHGKFLAFYLAAGLAAAAAQIFAAPASPFPMVGASGAIAGVMGGYLLLFPKAKVDVLFIFIIFFRIIAIPAWIVLGVWIGLQLFNGAATPTQASGVAYAAHIGGFLGGILMAVPAVIKRGGRGYWKQTEGHPQNPVAKYPLSKTNVPKVPRS